MKPPIFLPSSPPNLSFLPLLIKKLSNSSKNLLIPLLPFRHSLLSPVIYLVITLSLTAIFLASTNQLLKFSVLKLKLAPSKSTPVSKPSYSVTTFPFNFLAPPKVLVKPSTLKVNAILSLVFLKTKTVLVILLALILIKSVS